MGYPALLAKTNELVSAAQTVGALGAELNLARQRPALAGLLENCRFLDIGTGVGWLAIKAAKTWPGMRSISVTLWRRRVIRSCKPSAATLVAASCSDGSQMSRPTGARLHFQIRQL
jgi:hypothetical protein